MFLIGVKPGLVSIEPKKQLGGRLWEPGYRVIVVDENNWDFTANGAYRSARALVDTLKANKGTPTKPVRVVTRSRGGQIVCLAIRMWTQELLDAGVDPAAIEYWLLGNPETEYTGASVLFTAQDFPNYPGDPTKGGTPHTSNCLIPAQFHGGFRVGYGLPAVHPWKVFCVNNQYDGWADAPVNYASVPSLGVTSSFFGIPIGQPWWQPGMNCELKTVKTGYPHGDYARNPFTGTSGRTFDTTRCAVYVNPLRPNETHVWITSYPIIPALSKAWLQFAARSDDQRLRPAWAAGYVRPVAMPTINYASLPSLTKLRGKN